jgi:hypothetical protein
MIIKIKSIYLINPDYSAYNPDKDGVIQLETVAKLWNKTTEEALEELKNHPVFEVIEETKSKK